MKIKVISLFIIFFVSNLLAQSVYKDLYSLSNRIKFADYLYAQKDFLRAIDEYKVILQKVDNDTLKFRFANCFFRLNRFDESSENFRTLFFSSLSEEAKFLFFQSIFFSNDYSSFRKYLENKFYLPEKYNPEIQRLNSLIYFAENKNMPSVEELIKPFDDSTQAKLYLFYQLKKNPPQKNPTFAILFSSLLPGSGKFYTGEYTDGVLSLLTTGISLYLAINNFQHNHKFRGWFFTGLTAFFYGGNIYGSYLSAKNYNVNSKLKIDDDIKNYFLERNYFLPQINF